MNSRKNILNHFNNLIKKLEFKISSLQLLSRKFTWYRLSTILLGMIFSLTFYFSELYIISTLIFLFTIIVFSILVHFHNRIDRGVDRLKEWEKIKYEHIARMELNWKNIPFKNDSLNNLESAESDLNILGEKSLFHLINLCNSKQSKAYLRKWLNNTQPNLLEIVNRQSLVKDLVPLLNFRDRLYMLTKKFAKREFDGNFLNSWVKEHTSLIIEKKIFIILTILAPLNILLAVLGFFNVIIPVWYFTTFIYISIYFFGSKVRKKVFNDAEPIRDELNKIAPVFAFLDQYTFKSGSEIRKFSECFHDSKTQASTVIKKISNAVETIKMRKGNPFVWTIIRAFFPVDYFYAIKIIKLKNLISDDLHLWLDVFYQLEALSSLANFAFLNPEYSFPKIVDNQINISSVLNVKNLGHPLILKEKKITNNYKINEIGDIAIITGSNMSGKSTFLRSLGVNLLLAYSGSVVDAEQFETNLFRIFSCIKVSDSVTDGISYFYAEVKRLKELLDFLKEEDQLPVFFLIDEIFRGTNNIERLKGSRAFIKELSKLKGTGAIATHDLELVKLEEINDKIFNFHFKEEIENEKMKFGYKLNEGPCPTTNALKIMKIEGLPID